MILLIKIIVGYSMNFQLSKIVYLLCQNDMKPQLKKLLEKL